jgi:hypothetical protein
MLVLLSDDQLLIGIKKLIVSLEVQAIGHITMRMCRGDGRSN